MEIKSIIREIKLSELLNEPLSGDALIINNFFDDLFDGMEIDTLDKYPDSIFFIKNGHDIYMEQDYKNERLYCSHGRIWSFFEENLSLGYQEISDLIKVMVEQQLKEMVFTPEMELLESRERVEQQLKEMVFTPLLGLQTRRNSVEQHLKGKVFTPVDEQSILLSEVEQQLKEKVFTPVWPLRALTNPVEQQLKEKVFTP